MFRDVVVGLPVGSIVSATVQIAGVEGQYRSQAVDEVLHRWADAGARGAFCEIGSPPESATTTVRAVGTSEGDVHRASVQLANCDNRCLLVLANLLLGLGFQEQATAESMADDSWYRRISIDSSGEERERQRYDFRRITGFRERMYPGMSNVIGSKVSFEGAGSPRSFRGMRVQFHDVSVDAQFEVVAGAANLWRHLVKNGYPHTIEDLYNGDCFVEGITVDLFDDCTLEVKVDSFGGSEAAWNPLVNMLGLFRSEIAEIRIF